MLANASQHCRILWLLPQRRRLSSSHPSVHPYCSPSRHHRSSSSSSTLDSTPSLARHFFSSSPRCHPFYKLSCPSSVVDPVLLHFFFSQRLGDNSSHNPHHSDSAFPCCIICSPHRFWGATNCTNVAARVRRRNCMLMLLVLLQLSAQHR